MRTRAIVITGPFEDDDLARFAKLMRDIERQKPGETYAIAIHDAEGQGIEEAVRIVEKIFPKRERPN